MPAINPLRLFAVCISTITGAGQILITVRFEFFAWRQAGRWRVTIPTTGIKRNYFYTTKHKSVASCRETCVWQSTLYGISAAYACVWPSSMWPDGYQITALLHYVNLGEKHREAEGGVDVSGYEDGWRVGSVSTGWYWEELDAEAPAVQHTRAPVATSVHGSHHESWRRLCDTVTNDKRICIFLYIIVFNIVIFIYFCNLLCIMLYL